MAIVQTLAAGRKTTTAFGSHEVKASWLWAATTYFVVGVSVKSQDCVIFLWFFIDRCLKPRIINDSFTESEISDTIDSLKNNKGPGIDLIPGEFIKIRKLELVPLITGALNYIISNRDYPDWWAEGLRSPVFKSDLIKDTNNYRGIIVLSVFTKIFETAVNNRMRFVSGAYNTGDKYNGGFTKGSRTSDNLFILQLQRFVERQIIIEKPLYLW